MNCEDARELIHADLDHELGTEQREALRHHLRSCPQCRRQETQLRAMVEGFGWLARESSELPAGSVGDAGAAARTIPFPGWRRVAGIVAAAAAVTLFTTFWWLSPRDRRSVVELPETRKATARIQLTGASDHEYLAVPAETKSPNVHVVWLYRNELASLDDDSSSPAS